MAETLREAVKSYIYWRLRSSFRLALRSPAVKHTQGVEVFDQPVELTYAPRMHGLREFGVGGENFFAIGFGGAKNRGLPMMACFLPRAGSALGGHDRR